MKNSKTSDKLIAQMLADILAAKGMRNAVISSGSRNAPLIIAFDAQNEIDCLCIIDERSAAFFALGIAQQTNLPVGLICTSGSAALNYAPAIAEAFYQKIPLIVITADRPPEWIDQDDGQTINQYSLYSNYCKASFNLPVETYHSDDLWFAQRLISEAFNTATEMNNEGPVHINVPLREPLYKEAEKIKTDYKIIDVPTVQKQFAKTEEKKLLDIWNSSKRKLIICGLHKPNKELNTLLGKLAKNPSLGIMTETTSNMQDSRFIGNIEAVMDSIDENNKKSFQPELLITFGGPVTSKKLKTYLRKYKPEHHWHISVSAAHTNTFQALTKVLTVDEKYLFNLFSIPGDKIKSRYAEELKNISDWAYKTLRVYCKEAPFTDLKAIEFILNNLPENSDVHLGNSSPVRYANLFETKAAKEIHYYCNRGVSGIDGMLSTASGAASGTDKMTTLISGDLGFFYDSNALWSKYLSDNLRIIIINNSGGGIFRLIDSKDTPLLEKYFEANHSMRAELLVKAHNIPYYSAKNEKELKLNLNNLYLDHKGKCAVLEIFTPNEMNAATWAGYFNLLKNENKK
jgi:2-succinyl-5-enolpyruvyl-6-hydroxy-3-cyclohexene-1-carboxylate synthase